MRVRGWCWFWARARPRACASCVGARPQALRTFRALRVVAAGAAAACLLGLAAALGGGAAPLSRAGAGLAAAAALCGALSVWAGRFARNFVYVGWDHSANH